MPRFWFKFSPFVIRLKTILKMKKKSFVALIIILFLTTAAAAFAGQTEEDKILAAAENLFVQMKNKDYKAIWKSLTSKTKEIIIDDVYKASKKQKIEFKKEYLANDFSSNGPNAQAYWDSYLTVFDPVIVLEKCKWTMGKINEDTAEIYVQHKNSELPAVLKMFKEGDVWKLGLEETFGARKLNPF